MEAGPAAHHHEQVARERHGDDLELQEARAHRQARHARQDEGHHGKGRCKPKEQVGHLGLEGQREVRHPVLGLERTDAREQVRVEDVVVDEVPVVHDGDVVLGELGGSGADLADGHLLAVEHRAAGIEVGGIVLPARGASVGELAGAVRRRNHERHGQGAPERGGPTVAREHPHEEGREEQKRRDAGLGTQGEPDGDEQVAEDLGDAEASRVAKGGAWHDEHEPDRQRDEGHHREGEVEDAEDLARDERAHDAGELPAREPEGRRPIVRDRERDDDEREQHEGIPRHGRRQGIERRQGRTHEHERVGHEPARGSRLELAAGEELLHEVVGRRGIDGGMDDAERHGYSQSCEDGRGYGSGELAHGITLPISRRAARGCPAASPWSMSSIVCREQGPRRRAAA